MLRTTLRFILTLCLCGAGALGSALAWSDPVLLPSAEPTNTASAADASVNPDTTASSSTPTANIDTQADTKPDTKDAGTGLQPPPGLIAPGSAISTAAPTGVDKSLVSARHDAKDKQLRLGRELDEGMASWYGPHFYGRRTASGERFDRGAFTAAHKTLPLGARVVVSNPRTGKQIVVRINDRGPYFGNRILDLSEAAAKALGLKARGSDWVVMNEVLPRTDDAPTSATLAVAPTNPLAFPPPPANAVAPAPATSASSDNPENIASSLPDTPSGGKLEGP
jgi:rare lipoprotein A